MYVPNVPGSAAVCWAGYRTIWPERLMAPYMFSFMIDAESLVLGIGLGFVAAVAMVMIVKNL
jgi:hypothetical protein